MRTDKICDYHLTVEPAAILNPSFLIDFHGLMDILLSEIYHLTVEPRPIKENILFKNLVIFAPPLIIY